MNYYYYRPLFSCRVANTLFLDVFLHKLWFHSFRLMICGWRAQSRSRPIRFTWFIALELLVFVTRDSQFLYAEIRCMILSWHEHGVLQHANAELNFIRTSTSNYSNLRYLFLPFHWNMREISTILSLNGHERSQFKMHTKCGGCAHVSHIQHSVAEICHCPH